MNFEDLDTFVEYIFSKEPKPPCSYNLNIACDTKLPVLLQILLKGANKLYGPVQPKDITEEQFDKLNDYMQSIGFSIKYNYTFCEQDLDKITHINVWFVPYIKPAFNNNCGIYMKYK